MIKRTITYEDYNGISRTEDFYFNLTESELRRMNYSRTGGYAAYLEKIVNSKDVPEIMGIFESLILKTYGIKSEDGRTFEKSEELTNRFKQSPAYDIMFDELLENLDEAVKFFKGVLPSTLASKVDEELKKNPEYLKLKESTGE